MYVRKASVASYCCLAHYEIYERKEVIENDTTSVYVPHNQEAQLKVPSSS